MGTHMDAPCHYCENCWRMGDIPLEMLFGPAIVIDVKDKTDVNPNYEMTIQDLLDWEEKYGKIPKGAMVLVSK